MIKLAVLSLSILMIVSCFHADALKCYLCSTNNDTKCADPFAANDMKLIECPPTPNHIRNMTIHNNAQFCRKLKQTIDGKHQIITRSCGYLPSTETPESGQGCFKDAFSSFTSSIYCHCSSEGCNGAKLHGLNKNLLSVIFVMFAVLKYFNSD